MEEEIRMETYDEMLASPDVRAGELVYRIVKAFSPEPGSPKVAFFLLRCLGGDDPSYLTFDSFGDAVDEMENDSVRMSSWYGEPVWLRKPDFSLNHMMEI